MRLSIGPSRKIFLRGKIPAPCASERLPPPPPEPLPTLVYCYPIMVVSVRRSPVHRWARRSTRHLMRTTWTELTIWLMSACLQTLQYSSIPRDFSPKLRSLQPQKNRSTFFAFPFFRSQRRRFRPQLPPCTWLGQAGWRWGWVSSSIESTQV